METRRRWLARAALFLITGVWCASLAARQWDWRVVMTRSVPRGLYREAPPRWERGRLVEFCLCAVVGNLARRRGYIGPGECPGGVEPVVKFIVAVPGDTVVVDRWHVSVNGRKLRLSERPQQDAEGRAVPPVPMGSVRVGQGELWLHSGHHPRGLDSRLCGPVAMWQVVQSLEPMWTE